MTIEKFFRENPSVDAVARDWMDNPVTLHGVHPNGARPSIHCCGDPGFDWVGVENVTPARFAIIPTGWPEAGRPIRSLMMNPYRSSR